MLVLARKKGQVINIGGEIEITVVDVSGETVRIGIKAPASMEIYRREIYEELKKENTFAIADKKGLQQILSNDYAEKKIKKIENSPKP